MAYDPGYYQRNKVRMKADATARRLANPAAAVQATKRWRDKTGYRTQPQRRARQEQAATRPRPENCEVCGDAGRICWDHDHTTGQFRGWLCDRCNTALGMVKDQANTLRALADYLEHGNGK